MISHARYLKIGLSTNPIIATQLLNSYIITSQQSPTSLTYAHQLFDQVPLKDTTLWTSLISAYTRLGHPHKALQLFSQMGTQPKPNHFVYATVARAIGLTRTEVGFGRIVHGCVIKSGFLPNVVVETSLLDMYGKCGIVEWSRVLFDEMLERNGVSWNAMIAAYVSNGVEWGAMELFYRMKCGEFWVPDEFACASVLVGSARISDLEMGMQVHGYLVVVGLENECASGLCNMYFRCRTIVLAERVFREREGRNALLEHIMVRGYVHNGRYHDAIKFIEENNNFLQNFVAGHGIVVSVLTVCANLCLLLVGRQVHGLIVTLLGFQMDFQSKDGIVIISALIDMYCKCSSMGEARQVFDSVLPNQHVSHWNSMITGYVHSGLLEEANVCFKTMPERNVISWTAMISGYVQFGLPHEGLRLLAMMCSNEDGFSLEGNCLTYATALEACSNLTMVEEGKQIHAKLIRTTMNADTGNVVIGTALINMYSKSGNLNYAKIVFSRMVDMNVISWTSMITGYATHGLGFRALEVFQQMMKMGVEPNEVTFVSVLTSCSHCGLVEEGIQYFKLMKDKYGIIPRGDHYACVMDMLGRAGRLSEALSLLEEIENEEKIGELYGGAIRGALLGACRLHGNVDIGNKVAAKMLQKEEQVPDTYIALSNVYAEEGMWDEAYRVRERWENESRIVGKAGKCTYHVGLGSR